MHGYPGLNPDSWEDTKLLLMKYPNILALQKLLHKLRVKKLSDIFTAVAYHFLI